MRQIGIIQKMTFFNDGGEYDIKPDYEIDFDSKKLNLSSRVGKIITIRYLKRISCVNCGKDTTKSFGQGFCYPCFISVPQTEECVFHPELCRAHEGIARDMDYARDNCLVDQFVYLAISGGLKVGVTRYHQIPTRWVDQGAVKAIKVAITSNRYLAGLAEVELKRIYADKTNWRKMLMGKDEDQNLVEKKRIALEILSSKKLQYKETEDKEYSIQYPVFSYPAKVVSINLDTNPLVKGEISGIKGQYLLFTDGRVLNIRKHTGYHVDIEID